MTKVSSSVQLAPIDKPIALEKDELELETLIEEFLGTELASFFSDACKTKKNSSEIKSKVNVIAHLLREIVGDVTDKLLPIGYKDIINTERELTHKNFSVGSRGDFAVKVLDYGPTYKDKVSLIAKQFKIKKSNPNLVFWHDVLADKDMGLHKLAHRSNPTGVRKIDAAFEDLWENCKALIRFQTDLLQSNILADYKTLDTFLKKKTLKTNDIKKLKRHVPLNRFTLTHFFENSKQYTSILAFKDAGFFDFPTEPLPHEGGGYSFPPWPQAQFLKGAVKNKSLQNEVIDICLAIDTKNYNIQHSILEVVIVLPIDKAILFKRQALLWIDTQENFIDYRRYTKLIKLYISEGYITEGVQLMKNLLSFKEDPREPIQLEAGTIYHDPVSLLREHDFKEFLDSELPTLVSYAPKEIADCLLTLINDYIEFVSSLKNYGKDDYSRFWRPSVEHNPRSGLHNYLISSVRDLILSEVSKDVSTINYYRVLLDSVDLNITRRIKLHILMHIENLPDDKDLKIILTKSLVTEAEFNRSVIELSYEYFCLAEKYCTELSTYAKNKIWKWINTNAPTEEPYTRRWVIYHLKPFLSLGAKWKRMYEEALQGGQEPEYVSRESIIRSGSVESSPPISKEELSAKSVVEIVDYVNAWKPDDSDPINLQHDGLGNLLSMLVKENPNRWGNNLNLFKEVDKYYIRKVIRGFQEARKDGLIFGWLPILEFALNILVEHPAPEDSMDNKSIGWDPNWSWCRKAIADLLLDGLEDNSNSIPLKYRKLVWNVLSLLLNDPDPEHKGQTDKEFSHDFYTEAINSIRGTTLLAVIEYGIWIKLSIKKGLWDDWCLESDAPELAKALNKHLNIKSDPSLAIRSVYGQQLMRLAWLDEEWVVGKKDAIFPKHSKHQRYFKSAWDSYISFADPKKPMLELFNEEYSFAVRGLGKPSPEGYVPVSPDSRLVQHLTIFYIWGILDFGHSKLWDSFYEHSSVKSRAEVISFIGHSLSNWSDIKKETIGRLKDLMELRIKFVHEFGGDVEEFAEFGWWFASSIFDLDWRLEIMQSLIKLNCKFSASHKILDTLDQNIGSHPLETAVICKHIVDTDLGWDVLSWRDQIYTLLENIYLTKQQDARLVVEDTVKVLLSRGFTDFRSIL